MKDYLLSICIPTYNRKILLKRAIDSILSQSDDRVEVLVSDNASNDGTMEMLRDEYPYIRYSRNEQNTGAEANFLKCCELAQGKFFILFGSDDVLVDGALSKILNFLENNDTCSIVFMNHVFFEGDYIDLDHCTRKWREPFENIVTKQKDSLMLYAKERITFMSSLIFSKSRYSNVQCPQQYIWTYFLHTNIGFEMVKSNDSVVGVIGDYCVADNITYGDATVESNNMKLFEIFGTGLEYTICTHAVDCGFSSEQMKKIYLTYAKREYPRAILKIKAQKTYDWLSEYKEFVRPILKKYPVLCFYTIPFYLLPHWLARFIRNYIRSIYKKLKYKN